MADVVLSRQDVLQESERVIVLGQQVIKIRKI